MIGLFIFVMYQCHTQKNLKHLIYMESVIFINYIYVIFTPYKRACSCQETRYTDVLRIVLVERIHVLDSTLVIRLLA